MDAHGVAFLHHLETLKLRNSLELKGVSSFSGPELRLQAFVVVAVRGAPDLEVCIADEYRHASM